MSAAKKLDHIQTHVVDILGSTKGRDQPIMKMDKAVELVQCLDREILESDDYVFFDPFCKAGEILLATALVSNSYKNESKKIVSLDDIKKDIYESNRYFALAPDERHYKLSLRTFYGNKNSHKKVFMENMRNGSYLSEKDGRLDKEKFNKELTAMLEYIKEKSGGKKIIAVGNPPYQEEDSGHGKSAKALYNILINSLVASGELNEMLFVIPSRWFSGGKGLDKFREKMMQSQQIKKIKYFENPHEVFPTVEIRGGICFMQWSKDTQENTLIENANTSKKVNLSDYDIIVPHIQAYSILNKVLGRGDSFLDSIVWPRNPFGLTGDYFKKNKQYFKGLIECFSERKNIKKIDQSLISKNMEHINKYKVAFPRNSGGGKGHREKVLPKKEHFFLLKKNQISTETYSVAGSFDKLGEAENFLFFLQTYFSRFLFSLRKPTQGAKVDTFSWIPLLDMNIKWEDESLYKYFGINKKEQAYIKQRVDKLTA